MTFTAMPSLLMPDVQDIDIFPSVSDLTVAQAAKILDMPEACVNELLDHGSIEFRRENDERLIQQDSLLAFDTRYRKRCAVLAEITREWQEMGLYD